MRHFIVVCLAFTLFIGKANATPSRSAYISDQAIAANKTHLFVIRDINDNQGNHNNSLTHQFLVSIEIQSGKATQHWPIRISNYKPSDRGTGKDLPVAKPFKKFSNPYNILRQKNAMPIGQGVGDIQSKLSKKDGITLTKDDVRHTLISSTELIKRIRASLNPTMDIMPDVTNILDGIEYHHTAYETNLAFCKLDGSIDSAWRKVEFYALNCEGDGDHGPVDSYQILIPVAKIPELQN